MATDLRQAAISHNDFDAGMRGEWRKFNPANPYKKEESNKEVPDIKVESLDDLFSDEDKPKKEEKKIEEVKQEENIPTLPMEPNTEEDERFSKDLENQLESVFDELFGPIDENKK